MLGKSLFMGLALLATTTVATAQKTLNTNKAQVAEKQTVTKQNTLNAKSEAKAFALEVMKAHFRRDCNFIWGKFASTVKVIESGQMITLSEGLKAEFCNDNPLRSDKPVTYDMYIANYNTDLFTAAELKSQHPEMAEILNLQSNEYLFLGSQRKSETSEYVFRASDIARFVVAYVDGQYKITAL